MRELTNREKGFLAGLVEADGYIIVTVSNLTDGRLNVKAYIGFTGHLETIEWVKKKLNLKGKIYRGTCAEVGSSNNSEALKVLDVIESSLIIKKRKAELARALCERPSLRGRRLTDEECILRLRLGIALYEEQYKYRLTRDHRKKTYYKLRLELKRILRGDHSQSSLPSLPYRLDL